MEIIEGCGNVSLLDIKTVQAAENIVERFLSRELNLLENWIGGVQNLAKVE